MKKRKNIMHRYNDEDRILTEEELANLPWTKSKITAATEEDKQQLLAAFEHIHYSDIDTDIL